MISAYNRSKAQWGMRRAKKKWMAAFENSVNQLWPEHAGKIDWNDATHMFNRGLVHFIAAAKYVEAHR